MSRQKIMHGAFYNNTQTKGFNKNSPNAQKRQISNISYRLKQSELAKQKKDNTDEKLPCIKSHHDSHNPLPVSSDTQTANTKNYAGEIKLLILLLLIGGLIPTISAATYSNNKVECSIKPFNKIGWQTGKLIGSCFIKSSINANIDYQERKRKLEDCLGEKRRLNEAAYTAPFFETEVSVKMVNDIQRVAYQQFQVDLYATILSVGSPWDAEEKVKECVEEVGKPYPSNII